MKGRAGIFFFCICVLSGFVLIMSTLEDNGRIKQTLSENKNNEFVIIIDAGHGGSDGGAVAKDGTQEAYLNLQIAKRINDCLSLIGFKTVMTRTDENSIGDSGSTIRNEKVSDIHKRMDIMNSFENCIFLSIHQNYFQGSSSCGTQVFYSAQNPESELIAKSIQSSVISVLQPENQRAVKKSGKSIYLLYNAVKPAVLVECGFISNETDLTNLKNKEYQQELSLAVIDGIIDYLIEKGVLYGF